MRLLRLGGVAEELLASARAGWPESVFADRVAAAGWSTLELRSPGTRESQAGNETQGS
jgi:hypothetical protein